MFEDRPGDFSRPVRFPNNLTVDSMETRQATRNEALTSALGANAGEGNPWFGRQTVFHGATGRRRADYSPGDPRTLR